MEKLKTKIRRFFYNLKNNFFTFENIILFVAIVMCLGWTYGAISAMTRNWQLSQSLLKKDYQKRVLELEVENLKLENEYFASEEYEELSARKKLNKKLPGETLIYLAPNSETAKEKHDEKEEIKTQKIDNLSEWVKFLFGT